ncbi:Tl.2 family protein [Megaselia abdita]
MRSRIAFLILIFSIINQCLSFDTYSFLFNHCISKRGIPSFLTCSNFKFDSREIHEIQNSDFQISNDDFIQFEMCDPGIVNENFFDKFPNAFSITFENCDLSLKSSKSSTSNRRLRLASLHIHNSRVTDNKDSNALKFLPELKKLSLKKLRLENKEFDTKLFRRLYNLTNFECYDCGIEKIKDGGFDDFEKVEFFSIYDTKVDRLPHNLLSRMDRLKMFEFYGNDLTEIPKDLLPTSVVSINFGRNFIRKLDKNQFKGLNNLETLLLDNNLIEKIDKKAFKHVENIQILKLNNNKIKRLDLRVFGYLDNLRELDLRGNDLRFHRHDFDELSSGVNVHV